ncbi:phage scaffolding protein [Acetobacter malorum]|uniref:Phage minor structual protein GP20 n=1 Tax=Acetobacter malorum TaxID=178901 RepID=A0A1Y3G723_9PROT|nr:phage scaffolding protein [Acetobacter malorum]OUJ06641.1 hypothetical protein HK23_14275 [Acetobacter malorum]
MAENSNPADAGIDPNTVRELQRARADLVSVREELKRAREDGDAIRSERDAAIKARDGFKGQLAQQKGDFEAKLAEAQKETETAQSEAKSALEQSKTQADAAVIRAEAKAAATRLGAVAPEDVVKLLDLSAVKMGEDGQIEGLDDVMAAAKEARGYLFTVPAKPGTATGTTAAPNAPNPGKPVPFDARKATPEETAAKARELGINPKFLTS